MDGDECTVGLMAKHMLQAKELPVFFYGQSYGFCLLETTFISLAYCIGGINDYSVKLSMLTLWTIGIIFFYKTLRSICRQGSMLPLLVTLLFIFTPAWGAWSMKARGGYLTSFTLTWLITWILFSRNDYKPLLCLVLGLLFSITYQSQALWIPGLLPLLVYRFYLSGHRLRNTLLLLLGFTIPFAIFLALPHSPSDFSQAYSLRFSPPAVWEKTTTLPHFLFVNFHGFYYLFWTYPPPLANSLFALAFMLCLLGLIVWGIVLILKGPGKSSLYVSLFLAILFTILYVPFIPTNSPRYLLPISGIALLALGVFLDKANRKIVSYGLIMPLCIIGAIALFSFKNLQVFGADRSSLLASVKYLQSEKINYVFCPEELLQWQIDFYSNENVIARYYGARTRYPAYTRRVNEAFSTGERTAVLQLGADDKFEGMASVKFGDYRVYPDPSKQALENAGLVFQ